MVYLFLQLTTLETLANAIKYNYFSVTYHGMSITKVIYNQLSLIWQLFSSVSSARVKRVVFFTSSFMITSCSQLWRLHLINDIKAVERIQLKATKYISNDFISDYWSHLISMRSSCSFDVPLWTVWNSIFCQKTWISCSWCPYIQVCLHSHHVPPDLACPQRWSISCICQHNLSTFYWTELSMYGIHFPWSICLCHFIQLKTSLLISLLLLPL